MVLWQTEAWRHWRNDRREYSRTHLHQPLYGEYESRNPVVIRQQIYDAIAHGLDGFIINLNGKNSAENLIALSLLAEINLYNSRHHEKPFLYIISFDSKAQSPTEGKTPVSIEEDFEYLRDVWLTDAWVRNGESPVLFIFAYEDNFSEYKAAADKVFEHGADIIWPYPDRCKGGKAAFCWVHPDKTRDNGMWLDNDSSGSTYCHNYYKDCADNEDIQYVVGAVWPGFNDTLVRWAWDDGLNKDHLRPRIIPANTSLGNTLELTWQEVYDYLLAEKNGGLEYTPMPIVQIVTWNDWAESTAIEPDVETGYSNLKICSRYIRTIRNRIGVKTWK